MIMKTILFTIICIIALLWVGDFTIIILFVLAMAVYNIGEYAKGYKHGFDDGIKKCIETIKAYEKNRAHSHN